MKIPPLLSDLFLVVRWSLIHLAVFGYCSYTAIDQAYEAGWPDYSLIARILSLPVSLLGTYSIPLVVSNSLVWGLGALLLRKIATSKSGERLVRTVGVLFVFGGFYTFLLKGYLYLFGKGLPVAHRDDLLRDHPLTQILGFPTIQISEWFDIPVRLPLAFWMGVLWGGVLLLVWNRKRTPTASD